MGVQLPHTQEFCGLQDWCQYRWKVSLTAEIITSVVLLLWAILFENSCSVSFSKFQFDLGIKCA